MFIYFSLSNSCPVEYEVESESLKIHRGLAKVIKIQQLQLLFCCVMTALWADYGGDYREVIISQKKDISRFISRSRKDASPRYCHNFKSHIVLDGILINVLALQRDILLQERLIVCNY